MAFLNNSGDIILDAVLTDLGRERLAKGEGFAITKFALGDDEIDYSLYDSSQSTALSDLQILQTPVLEAFTNNASSMKSKLLTISKSLLYLPVIKINNQAPGRDFSGDLVANGFVVSANSATQAALTGRISNIIDGATTAAKKIIRLDQGIDSEDITSLDAELKETQYIIEFDSRLGALVGGDGVMLKTPAYIDDDYIASYFLQQTTDAESVKNNDIRPTDVGGQNNQVISGARGTVLEFSLQISSQLQTSDFLFNSLGTVDSTSINGLTLKKIITNIIVTGATTGYNITIPIVIVKSV